MKRNSIKLTATHSQHIKNTYDHADIAKRLKRSILYIVGFFLFYISFTLINSYYINKEVLKDGPIDSHASHYCFFDADYVYKAKHEGYYIDKYFKSFLPLDIIFPIFYTLMFLTVLKIFRDKNLKQRNLYKTAVYLVYAGMIFDYLENSSFSVYLLSSFELSTLVAFFTTIKTFLFALNLIVFALACAVGAIIYFKQRKLKK